MPVCPECHAKVLPDQEVCRACGEPLPPEQEGPDPLLGRTIGGKFRIDRLLGEGAMGRVYAAHQISLEKDVAIKVLHAHLTNDPRVKKRFHREARAASRLSHPNSLQILDFGADEEDGTLFIAMELLDGPDLLELIRRDSPLSPRRIAGILGQVLSALDEAHHAGIIHRDLKPENVIVLAGRGGEEHVKVCDFGIAKLQEAEGGSAITVTGFVCGTPEYMAPEQARGEALDRRADVYAAGCMLYQMLTGRVPFIADSALGIITQHLTQDAIAPRKRRPELSIPVGLQAVCLEAMRKDRDARYADAASMKAALDEVVATLGELADLPLGSAHEDPTAPTHEAGDEQAPPLPTHGPARWAVPLALLAVGGVAVAFALGRAPDAEPPAVPIATAPVPVPTATDAGTGGPTAATDAAGTADAAGVANAGAGRATADDGGEDAPAPTSGSASSPRPRPRPRPTGTMDTAPAPLPEPAVPAAESAGRSPGADAFEEGRRLFLANDVAGAIAAFERAARLMPRNAQVHKQLGRAYMRQGDVSRGVASYRRYLDLSPNASDRSIIEAILRQHGG